MKGNTTMDCSEFRNRWSEWHDGDLAADAARAMAGHRSGCPACRRHDHQMRAMLAGLAALPLPGQAVPAAPAARSRRRPALAAAAALVLAFGAGLLVQQGLDDGRPGSAIDTVALEPGGTREVDLAFATPRALESVELEIELPRGVELAGHPGERVVRWETRLAAGHNRLRLPLEVAADASGGELVARMRHASGTREWRVALEPGGGQTSLAPRQDTRQIRHSLAIT